MDRNDIILSVTAVLLAVVASYLGYSLYTTEARLAEQGIAYTQTLKDAEKLLGERQSRIIELENLLTETQILLQETVDEKESLAEDLEEEQDRNDDFENQIKKIGSTVGTLDKLAKTDEELLQKYSKVYFLNEHYMPEKLVAIDKQYLYREDVPKFIHAEVNDYIEDMFNDALDDGIKLWVVSAFRSFDEQEDLKGAYSVTYGSGANTFSADQGYSEHQLGTTVDLTTEALGGGLIGFESTPAYEWLTKNAHKYGFALSYPKDNAYYIFEPWHWRFVGIELARDLHNDNKYFYDLDQREINEYLISLFD